MQASVAAQVVLDVRRDAREDTNVANVRAELLRGLQAPPGAKSIPTVLLYDVAGLKIYDKITTDAPEYYLFGAEEQILRDHSDDIVNVLHAGRVPIAGEVVIELGAGALRKTSHVLNALARSTCPLPNGQPAITYYALDLERRELDRTLALTDEHLGHVLAGKVATRGMLGTYEDGIDFVRNGGLEHVHPSYHPNAEDIFRLSSNDQDEDGSSPSSRSESLAPSSPSMVTSATSLTSSASPPDTPLHFMFLGSSLGNFAAGDAASFLRNLPLRPGSGDKLLIGLDHDNDKDLVELAYNDPKGITRDFIMNGLKAAGRVLGNEDAFDSSRWEYANLYNQAEKRHEAYYRSTCDQSIELPPLDGAAAHSVQFTKGELVHVEYSYKYSDEHTSEMFSKANLRPIHRWTEAKGRYSLWLLERPPFDMPLLKVPIEGSAFNLPTLEEWDAMWKVWDIITLQMIPRALLHVKPIDLRHKCLFYLGHIPTFLDIHLSRFLNEPHTKPEAYKYIFERGIDPIVDDPSQCHAHSEVPQSDDEWPQLEEILDFRDRVRQRVKDLYRQIEEGERELTRRTIRVLSMTLEHEQMHAETLLYMLLQVADNSSEGTLPPPGFTLPPWKLLSEAYDKAHSRFKLLCEEKHSTTVTLGPASVILGHDDKDSEDSNLALEATHGFGWDNESPSRRVDLGQFRIEWRPISNGQFYEYYKSLGDQAGIPIPKTWVEIDGDIYVRTLYGPIPMEYAYHWPVVASYDELSAYARVQGGRIPTEPELRLFFDTFCYGYMGGMNIGFHNWHPVPATTGGTENEGRGQNGGVWEWTSTNLAEYEGYSPSELYPGYSCDFFDDHHKVVLGGSYATPPRLAQRRTFRNWYQHNYPYAWVGARIAYDV